MEITIFGSGYVGLVVSACLARAGHQVTCADIDADRVRRLNSADLPIYEPGLESLLSNGLAEGRLRFTVDAAEGVQKAKIIFVAVGTPAGDNGVVNLDHVLEAAGVIADHLRPRALVVLKSTVPPGSCEVVRAEIASRTDRPFFVCANPEFLKEGNAVGDFMYPDRVICGVDSDHARTMLEDLYEPFVRSGNPVIFTDIASAEMTKYAANAMLATRISFMNQFAELCEKTGADIEVVRQGIGLDARIGPLFLYAGAGFGGSCLSKDLQGAIGVGKKWGVDLSVLRAVSDANDRQKTLIARKICRRFGDDLSGKRFALWGLAFKPETDDMRDAPSLAVIAELRERGASIIAHDPAAMEKARLCLGDEIRYGRNEYEILDGADALVVTTNWFQYRRPDWYAVAERLAQRIVFDGRNIFDIDRLKGLGFEYYPVGRRQVGPEVSGSGRRSEPPRGAQAGR